MKTCLSINNPPKSCDANGDGVVDTRDLIDLLRAFMIFQQQNIIAAGKLSIPTAASAAASATTTTTGQ